MKRKPLAFFIIVGVVLLAIYYLYGGSTAPEGQAPLVRLNTSHLASLQDEFNKSANSVRLLVMLSPT